MRPHARPARRGLAAALALLVLPALPIGAQSAGGRVHSALFEVDGGRRAVTGPATRLPTHLSLRLVSVAMDQPQYWPNEKVRVKVLMPTHGGGEIVVRWNRRDAGHHETRTTLDAAGVAVVEILDGERARLELGEYRVAVRAEGADLAGTATFTVVEGSLGALSLAHDFKRVTDPKDLDREKGAWFFGNLNQSGQRWGNDLAFVNELRVDNAPYRGEVKVVSRCMLPGCNGIHAGPPQDLHVHDGRVHATMSVRGHSGPFHLEFVTDQGTIVHPLDGTSHVEREMHAVSRGVRWNHRAGLAPYEDTVQVPGRSLFVESKRSGDDPFEIASAIAEGGRAELKFRARVTGGAVHVWSPGEDGRFVHDAVRAGNFARGETVSVPVAQPFSLVTVGGFVGERFVEGWSVVFSPAGLEIALDVSETGGPESVLPITIDVRDAGGNGAKVSGILEVFDNRVASRNPATPLASSIGDAIRNLSRPLMRFSPPRMERAARDALMEEAEPAEMDAPAAPARMPRPTLRRAPSGIGGGGLGARGRAAGGAGMGDFSTGPATRPAGEATDAPEDDAPIREGEKKVVFAGRVETDAHGRAVVDVTLPPQTGRVTVRFVAVHGFDHAVAEARVDVSQAAWAELRLPTSFVPGARLDTVLTAVNESGRPARVEVKGAGIDGTFSRPLATGRSTIAVPWVANGAGTVEVRVVGEDGSVLDRRARSVRDAVHQEVTFSRLALAGGGPVRLEPGERAVVYRGAGHLLGGIVADVFTTLESWFPHAEALGAQAAVRATLLAAIEREVIPSEGFEGQLEVGLERAVRDLETAFFDAGSGLVRPYPGVAPDPLWSAWTARSLHAVLGALEQAPEAAARLSETVVRAEKMARAIDDALAGRAAADLEGYDPRAPGRFTIPVVIDGEVVYRAVVDDAVRRFVADDLWPHLDLDAKDAGIALGNAYDVFRFLRAFERTGGLQYLTESAIALWHGGPSHRAEFDQLFAVIARGTVAARDPGLLQGPALLGGVYGTPMALVRFLELLLLMEEAGTAEADARVTLRGGGLLRMPAPPVRFGEPVEASRSLTLLLPEGAVARIDQPGTVSLADGGARLARTALTVHTPAGPRPVADLAVAEEAVLEIVLDEGLDPLHHYAIIAVPTTTVVKRTEDILSDYRGELLYGQQSIGAVQMQTLTVPFRGSRRMRLVLEGAYPGTSPGLVAVRHMSDPSQTGSFALAPVTVRR